MARRFALFFRFFRALGPFVVYILSTDERAACALSGPLSGHIGSGLRPTPAITMIVGWS